MAWIHLAQNGVEQGPVVNTVMNIRLPKEAGNFLIS